MCNRPLCGGHVLGIRPFNWTNFRPIKGLVQAGRQDALVFDACASRSRCARLCCVACSRSLRREHRDCQRLEAAFHEDAQAVAMIASVAAEVGRTFVGAGGLVSADEDGALEHLTSETMTGGLGWRNPPGWVSVPA
jgi:hypothetical protein